MTDDQRSEKESRGRFKLDFAAVLVIVIFLVLLLWMTSELWLPHYGKE